MTKPQTKITLGNLDDQIECAQFHLRRLKRLKTLYLKDKKGFYEKWHRDRQVQSQQLRKLLQQIK